MKIRWLALSGFDWGSELIPIQIVPTPEALLPLNPWRPTVVLIEEKIFLQKSPSFWRHLKWDPPRNWHLVVVQPVARPLPHCWDTHVDDVLNSVALSPGTWQSWIEGKKRWFYRNWQWFKLARRYESLAQVDDLTQLLNMRGFRKQASLEMERSRRYNRPLSIVMMDVDNFKWVNDFHDHLFGSYVLKQLGQWLKKNTRSLDIVARYGGDEFILALPETNPEGAWITCERLRHQLEKIGFQYQGHKQAITASWGVVTWLEPQKNPTTLENLMERADQALYQAKNQGKNTVVLLTYGESHTSEAA